MNQVQQYSRFEHFSLRVQIKKVYKERRFRDNRFSDESPKKARAIVKKREAMAVRDTRFEGESCVLPRKGGLETSRLRRLAPARSSEEKRSYGG